MSPASGRGGQGPTWGVQDTTAAPARCNTHKCTCAAAGGGVAEQGLSPGVASSRCWGVSRGSCSCCRGRRAAPSCLRRDIGRRGPLPAARRGLLATAACFARACACCSRRRAASAAGHPSAGSGSRASAGARLAVRTPIHTMAGSQQRALIATPARPQPKCTLHGTGVRLGHPLAQWGLRAARARCRSFRCAQLLVAQPRPPAFAHPRAQGLPTCLCSRTLRPLWMVPLRNQGGERGQQS